jgi:hypothetical protein
LFPVRRIEERLYSKDQTGRKMYGLIQKYSGDLRNTYIRKNGRLVSLASLPLLDYYNVVRKMPYLRDKKPVETIARPRLLLNGEFSGVDCKKKAILIGSWLRLNGRRSIPGFQGWRLISVSTRPDKKIHHVFPQVKIGGEWLNLDATYSDYKPFQKKLVTKAEVLKP